MAAVLGLSVSVIAWAGDNAPSSGPAANAPRPTATTGPSTKPTGGANVPASQLLDSLLKPTSASGLPLKPVEDRPAIDQSTGKAAVAPNAPQLNLMREGAYVVDRVGRLTRAGDGNSFELTFDADGRVLKDPPMVILPNQKLMQMENAVQGSSRDVRFRCTGMVTEYKGRNYILLEKVVVVPDVQQQF